MPTWTTPKTWLTGEPLTASDMNTHIRDNVDYLKVTSDAVNSYLLIRDEKTSGTSGGSFTSGAWRTRDLNTEVYDGGGNASLSSNQITLQPGTYRLRAFAPGRVVGLHQARFQNITDAATVATGTSEDSMTTGDSNFSVVHGVFTITAAKVFELQHRCTTTATNGFGKAGGFTTEVYAVVELWRIA